MSALESGRHYRRQTFTNLTLPRARLERVELDECVFERCSFTESTFYRCKLTACRFVRCDLSLLQVPNCLLTEVRFEGSKAIGIDWTKAGTTEAARVMMSLSFDECVLDYASFFGLSLRSGTLTRCSAKEADFAEADLRGAACAGTDFAGAKFLHTNLEGADFTGATGYAIDPTANRMKGARFSLPEAVSLLRGFEIVIE